MPAFLGIVLDIVILSIIYHFLVTNIIHIFNNYKYINIYAII